mgnify:CR=1 FL=1
MKVLTLVFSAVIASTAIPACAAPDQWPPIKPGYWEVSTIFFSDTRHPVVSDYCIDEKTTKIIKWVIEGGLNPSCPDTKEDISGRRVVIDTICKEHSAEYSVHITADFPTDSKFHSVSTVHAVRPKRMPDSSIPKDGKWVGACPKDIRPGDAMMGDGAFVHITPTGRIRPINP